MPKHSVHPTHLYPTFVHRSKNKEGARGGPRDLHLIGVSTCKEAQESVAGPMHKGDPNPTKKATVPDAPPPASGSQICAKTIGRWTAQLAKTGTAHRKVAFPLSMRPLRMSSKRASDSSGGRSLQGLPLFSSLRPGTPRLYCLYLQTRQKAKETRPGSNPHAPLVLLVQKDLTRYHIRLR